MYSYFRGIFLPEVIKFQYYKNLTLIRSLLYCLIKRDISLFKLCYYVLIVHVLIYAFNSVDFYICIYSLLRLGILLVPKDDPAVPVGENPGYSLAKAFSYISQTVTAKKALNWLTTVSI